jgi:hypothetical protein
MPKGAVTVLRLPYILQRVDQLWQAASKVLLNSLTLVFDRTVSPIEVSSYGIWH